MIKVSDVVELKVDGLGINGEGVARLDGFTIFVDGALPNELVIAKINLLKPSYAKAQLIEVLKESKERVLPACSRFKECGGCQIMHLSYQEQLFRKNQMVKDSLKHIGGFSDVKVLPIIASPNPYFYRNKIQLPIAQGKHGIITGFYRHGSHDIIPYEKCLVHHEVMENTVEKVRSLIQKSPIEPYVEHNKNGTLRHFIVRSNHKGEQLLGLITTGKQTSAIADLAQKIKDEIKEVEGVVESINKKKHNAILGDVNRVLCGRSFLIEEIDDLLFKLSLPSFFQINLEAAKLLYENALTLAEIDENSLVLDAYCGTGTLALLSAKRAKQVIGAEIVEQAVIDARKNAKLNKMDNVRFVVGKVEGHLHLFEGIDIAFINPPRKGLLAPVCDAINNFGPKRVIYISCNPSTLARDVKLLTNYSIACVQPIDMFPQTMHVETVVALHRRSNR